MRLQLNASKTEMMLFGTAALLRTIPSDYVLISTSVEVIKSVSVVRDIDAWIDSELTRREHVLHSAQACFFHHLRSISKILGSEVTIQLVCALVLSRLEHCNGVLVGLPNSIRSFLFYGSPSRIQVSLRSQAAIRVKHLVRVHKRSRPTADRRLGN